MNTNSASQAVVFKLVVRLSEHEDSALEIAQDLAGLPHHHTVRVGPRHTLLQRFGAPGAGVGPPGERWVLELEGWLRVPRMRA